MADEFEIKIFIFVLKSCYLIFVKSQILLLTERKGREKGIEIET